ncbi:MAG: hypothetical protein AAB903_03555 [Patescibacteria group bacterium]
MPNRFEETADSGGDQKKPSARQERNARLEMEDNLNREVIDFISSYEAEMVETPPGVNRKEFFKKKLWDLWVEPFFEYEDLIREINEEAPSKTKTKEGVHELDEKRKEAEEHFSRLPGWKNQKTDKEKITYLRRVAKTIVLY